MPRIDCRLGVIAQDQRVEVIDGLERIADWLALYQRVAEEIPVVVKIDARQHTYTHRDADCGCVGEGAVAGHIREAVHPAEANARRIDKTAVQIDRHGTTQRSCGGCRRE